jgi:hypothetical protein
MSILLFSLELYHAAKAKGVDDDTFEDLMRWVACG